MLYPPGVNLLLLESNDFIHDAKVRLSGRRLEHVRTVHRAQIGDSLRVGLLGGKVGQGQVESLDEHAIEMTIELDSEIGRAHV